MRQSAQIAERQTGTAAQERGNANAQSWSASVEGALGSSWARLGLRQLSGMLILVYVRKKLLVRAPLSPAAAAPPGVEALLDSAAAAVLPLYPL